MLLSETRFIHILRPMSMERHVQYWLLKSEPDEFGIDDLEKSKGQTTAWTGVRNFQARNHLRNMKKGDGALFYHSSCAVPGVVGTMQVVREAYPDPTQFDPESDYFDSKSPTEDPRWSAVDLKFVSKALEPMTLESMREIGSLSELLILRRGNRLSVTPIDAKHWKIIQKRIRP